MTVPITSDLAGYERFWGAWLSVLLAIGVTLGSGVLVYLWKIERNTRRRESDDL